MKLAISNIAWKSERDQNIYKLMEKYGYSGLEIAPSRCFPETIYEDLDKASIFAKSLKDEYGYSICSMQSIWYGRAESIFGTESEVNLLTDYTKKALDFAKACACPSLVFGCPKNRVCPDNVNPDEAISFFKTISEYAYINNACIAMEANPTIYNTNYINHTKDAIGLIEKIDTKGFRLNLDVGTLIVNEEDLSILKGHIDLISHVHISEPYLAPIQRRKLHEQLADLLYSGGYDKYISIEMGTQEDISVIEDTLSYVKDVFK